MELSALILSAREYLSRFDYDHYPDCFAEFEAAAAPFFDGLDEGGAEGEAAALIDALAAGGEALSRRERKPYDLEIKQVLALFLTPAAQRRGGAAALFAQSLCRDWCARYPRNPYYPGDYETIMKGFDANLLGLPLRKSKKRR